MSVGLHRTVAVLIAALGVAPAVRTGEPDLDAVLVANGLVQPVFLSQPAGEHHRLFVAEKSGRIRIIEDGVLQPAAFLDLSAQVGSPHGLLTFAFHPNYSSNGFLYVNYLNLNNDTVIARYQLSADPDVVDPLSALTIFMLDQPVGAEHVIGWIGFGPDGYLWLSSGDGGPSGCPQDRAQNLTLLHGKILRIDIECDGFPEDPNRYYDIPPDNPFVGSPPVRDEIWSYGLRQPWRCAFDPATGDLYIGDVGRSDVEELDFQPASSTGGENYGWMCMEGSICGIGSGCPGSCVCGSASLVAPLHEYLQDDSGANAIIGGPVYRGCAIPALDGAYFYSEYGHDDIYVLRHDGSEVTSLQEISAQIDPPGPLDIRRVASFGVDSLGEIYLLDLIHGEVFKVVPASPPLLDCNGNGTEDACDIASGASDDDDRDGVPDECPGCPWDLDGGGGVGITDLLALLSAWGTDPGGPPDFDDDGTVGITDLLALLGQWGPCL